MSDLALARFATAYAAHRESEGRDYSGPELLALPFLKTGRFAEQWAVRARTFDAFMRFVVRPNAARSAGPLHIADLGAGNGWLSYRLATEGHFAIAVDIRGDDIDGLGAAEPFLARVPGKIERVEGSFDALPLDAESVDIAVFNASLHYALDLRRVLTEAARIVRPGGCLAILDSPFYADERDGLAMVAEKHASAGARFGSRAAALLDLPFIEFLTPERLRDASASTGLVWSRTRVRYPLPYELRPLRAWLRRQRRPSRFDLWTSRRP